MSSQEVNPPNTSFLLYLFGILPTMSSDLPVSLPISLINSLQVPDRTYSTIFRLGDACTEGIVDRVEHVSECDEDAVGGCDGDTPVRAKMRNGECKGSDWRRDGGLRESPRGDVGVGVRGGYRRRGKANVKGDARMRVGEVSVDLEYAGVTCRRVVSVRVIVLVVVRRRAWRAMVVRIRGVR